MKLLKQRLKWALENAPQKLNQADLAAFAKISRSAVSDLFSGKSKEMKAATLTAFSTHLVVSPHWLENNVGEPRDGTRLAGNSSMTPIRAWEYQDELPAGEYVFIPRLEVQLGAGPGKEQMHLEFIKEEQPQAFRADWIRKKKLKPAKLASMVVNGDSMEPRLFDGDAVIVDTSQIDVIDGKVYALWYDDGERVKRLFRRPGGGLIVHSDNENKYPQMTLTPKEAEHVRIIGRIVHVAGDGGL